MRLMKFFSWLDTHLPYAILSVAALALISAGFYVIFVPAGPIVTAIAVGMVQLKYVYGAFLVLAGAVPIFALATRNIPLMLKASTGMLIAFAFMLATRLIAVGVGTFSWIMLLLAVVVVFMCRIVIWWQQQ